LILFLENDGSAVATANQKVQVLTVVLYKPGAPFCQNENHYYCMYTQVMVTMMIAHKVPDERGGAAGGCRSKVPARVAALYRSHFLSPTPPF